MNDSAARPDRGPAHLPAWAGRLLQNVAGPYPAASVFALALASGIDVVAYSATFDPLFTLFLAGLVFGLGTLHGVAWQLAQAALRRLPPLAARLTWTAAALIAGTMLAQRLGGFSHLGGRYRALALTVLSLCGLSSAVLAAVLAGLQPTELAARGYLGGLERRRRLGIGAALLVAAVALGYVDQRFYAGLYASAHLALRLGGLWSAMFALVLADRELHLPRLTRARVLMVVGLAAVPLIFLTDRRQTQLERFERGRWPASVLAVARALLDFDADGSSSLLGGGDCAPFDSHVHPQAREIPGNGIDDNCMAGDAKPRREEVETLHAPAQPSPLDVVLITIDTLRPDHMGVYNAAYGPKGRATTPNLDRWAQRATVFRNVHTPGGWTSIAIPSLMRGLYPRRLEWIRWYETNFYAMLRAPLGPQLRPGERSERIFPFAHADAHAPLARRLKRRGMYTAAIVDDGYSDLLKAGTGLDRDFNVYRSADSLSRAAHDDAGVVNLAISTLRQLPPDRRFFLWVHLFGLHVPNEQHAGVRVYGTTQPDCYDHELAFLDQQLKRLLDTIEMRSRASAIFIAADHGEHFDQQVRYHGYNLAEDVIRVPLLARVPGWPVGTVDGVVGLIDLVPTILALTQTPTTALFDGVDLGPVVRGSTKLGPRILLSDTWRFEGGQNTTDYVAAYDGQRKVILDRLQHQLSAFDQRKLDAQPMPVHDPATDTLAQAIYKYLDETSGELRVRD